MSCVACKCGEAFGDTGFDCTQVQDITYKMIITRTFDSLGVRNSIPFTASLDQAYFDALINNADTTKRWYPTPAFKNVEDIRGENIVFEFDDQTKEFLAEGAREFKAMIPGVSGSGANSPQMKEILERLRCGDYSVWLITNKNQLVGNLSADGLSLQPIEIDEQSVVAQFMKKTNATPQHLLFSLNFSQILSDASLRLFDCDEIGGANLLGLRGLLGICAELIDVTYTTLKVKLKSVFGTSLNPVVAPGLLSADFVSSDDDTPSNLYNETDAAKIAITGLVEAPAGTYEFTFLAQDIGDAIVVKPVKAGYEFQCVEDNPIDLDS